MSILTTTIAFCVLVSAVTAFVPLTPEEALRPPKRAPPPPPPTLPPRPYNGVNAPFRQGSALLGLPQSDDTSSPVATPGFSSPVAGGPLPTTSPVFRDEVRDKEGQFSIRFSNGDGTLADETGQLKSTDDGWEYTVVKTGSYQYISPEGTKILVKYTADDTGFHPQISYS